MALHQAKWQLETTCNWGVGSRFADYISGFLNLQIEHHVATKMPGAVLLLRTIAVCVTDVAKGILGVGVSQVLWVL